MKKQNECSHKDGCLNLAAFLDDFEKVAYLLQECEHCGKCFILAGKYPLEHI